MATKKQYFADISIIIIANAQNGKAAIIKSIKYSIQNLQYADVLWSAGFITNSPI